MDYDAVKDTIAFEEWEEKEEELPEEIESKEETERKCKILLEVIKRVKCFIMDFHYTSFNNCVTSPS